MSLWRYMEIKIAVAATVGIFIALAVNWLVGVIVLALTPYDFFIVLLFGPAPYITGLIVGWRRTHIKKN